MQLCFIKKMLRKNEDNFPTATEASTNDHYSNAICIHSLHVYTFWMLNIYLR